MRRVATFFFGLGVAIGLIGSVGLAIGFRPSELPATLLDISVYKLVFIAAGCVLAAGALVRRAERWPESGDGREPPPELLSPGTPVVPPSRVGEREHRQERR